MSINKILKLPEGRLTVQKIVQSYLDIIRLSSAQIMACRLSFLRDWQYAWIKIKYDGTEGWIVADFGLTVQEDKVLSELACAYPYDTDKQKRLEMVSLSIIRNMMDQDSVESLYATLYVGMDPMINGDLREFLNLNRVIDRKDKKLGLPEDKTKVGNKQDHKK